MTKQPPFGTKLRLSKLCRGIIALAVIKLCVLAAIVADIPLPELRWETSSEQVKQSQKALQTADAPQSTTLVMGTPERSLLATTTSATTQGEQPVVVQGPESSTAAANTPANTSGNPSHTGAAPYALVAEPQGSAAAAAASRLRPTGSRAMVTMPASSITKEREDSPVSPLTSVASTASTALAASPRTVAEAPAVNAMPAVPATATPQTTTVAEGAPLLSTGVETQNTNADESSWWHNMLQLTHLPVPQLGVARVAHAASLDTPPAPAVPATGGNSPFTPPAQQIMRGQDASGNPIPPRSTTARPLPAGNSGLPSTTNVDPMVTAVPPPAPNVNAYVPPEDPNRKQQELARREQEILGLKQQMEQRLKELERAESRVKGMLKDANDVEQKKVSGLIAVYANMKPKQAAQTLQSLDERVAVKILTGLTPKQAGEILSYADPKITAKLTELMTRMQMQP